MKTTITNESGQTRYACKCKLCGAKWMEHAGHFTQLATEHHCDKSDKFRQANRWYDYLSIWIKFNSVQWEAKPDGSTSKCGAKCISAKGHVCDCACHGKYHGTAA